MGGKMMEAAANVLLILSSIRARPDTSPGLVNMTGVNKNETGSTIYGDEQP
jgi:hypothetical protein